MTDRVHRAMARACFRLAQLTAGAAWWYREYAKKQSPEDRGHYESSGQEAKNERLGPWVDKAPVPPREWRGRNQPKQLLVGSPVRERMMHLHQPFGRA